MPCFLACRAYFSRKAGHRGDSNRLAQWNFNSESVPDSGDHAGRQQRVAAQLKKIILGPDSVDTKNLCPDSCNRRFFLRARHSGCTPEVRARTIRWG